MIFRIFQSRTFKYALPCIIIWSMGLLIFWPGMMSHDSIIQWNQLSQNRYSNLQPVFHTLFMKSITMIWDSPGAVCLVQILMLGTLLGFFLKELESLGIQKKHIWLSSALIAINPINIVLSITLWKDILYTILVLCCCLLFLKIGKIKTQFYSKNYNIILLPIVFTLPYLVRWNGIFILLGCFFFLYLLFPEKLRINATLFLSAIILITITKGVMTNIFQVSKSELLKYLIPIHHMGYFIHSDVQFNNSEIEFLNKISPTDTDWHYECGAEIASPWRDDFWKFDREFLIENGNRFINLWINKVINNPLSLLNHYKCSTRYIWHPYAFMESKIQLKTVPREIDKISGFKTYDGIRWIPYINEHKIESDSKLPQLVKPMTNYIKSSMFIWKPAIFLYLVFFVLFWQLYKKNHNAFLFTYLPIIAHTLGLALVTISPEFRYQYPVVFFCQLVIISCLIPMQSKNSCQK